MRLVFVDTGFWIALANPRDEHHEAALSLEPSLQAAKLFSTDECLTEFLNFVSSRSPELRQAATMYVKAIRNNANVTIAPQSRKSFLDGLDLYENRKDKEYSLTDCISMNYMRANGIQEVACFDKHFVQEGFTRLP